MPHSPASASRPSSAGRDPDAIGWQGGLAIPADDDFDAARRRLDVYRDLGASHVSVITMNVGRTPEQHLDVIARAGTALRAELS